MGAGMTLIELRGSKSCSEDIKEIKGSYKDTYKDICYWKTFITFLKWTEIFLLPYKFFNMYTVAIFVTEGQSV